MAGSVPDQNAPSEDVALPHVQNVRAAVDQHLEPLWPKEPRERGSRNLSVQLLTVLSISSGLALQVLGQVERSLATRLPRGAQLSLELSLRAPYQLRRTRASDQNGPAIVKDRLSVNKSTKRGTNADAGVCDTLTKQAALLLPSECRCSAAIPSSNRPNRLQLFRLGKRVQRS